MASEKTNLFEDLVEAYGWSSHGTFASPTHDDDEYMTDYNPLKLSSVRVCGVARGSILKSPVIAAEQILISLVFAACALPVYIYFKTDANGDMSLRRFLSQQESKMRAFASIMTGLAAFLLSFYTSIIVGRWWTMRTAGIGALKAATVDLQMLLFQCVSQEERVLSAIARYGRASLMLIYMWRRKELGDLKAIMMKRELLDEEECEKLIVCKHCLHETIWAWQTAIVLKLQRQGKIPSDQVFTMLLEKCCEGRAAVQCIHTHLAVRVPMQYVHLLGLLVKMHNLVLAIIMGLLFGAALRNGYIILCIQLFARTLILPFLFNAILLINCDLSDPFNGGEADFPVEIYQEALGKDCAGIVLSTKNAPDWIRSEAP